MAQLENSFGSNTCRCTGYRPILDTIKTFADDPSSELCQRVQDIEELSTCVKDKMRICNRKCSDTSESDWSIVNEASESDGPLKINFGDRVFFKVFEKDHIFEIFRNYGVDSYKLIDGNTGKGDKYVNFTFYHNKLPYRILCQHITTTNIIFIYLILLAITYFYSY